MDSRNIKEQPEEVVDGKYLEKIYQLQLGLIDHYIGIEGLPKYPLNVNTKSSQTLIKDFVGRVIEELAEAHESILFIDELVQKNRYWFMITGASHSEKDNDLCLAIDHLQNVSEEYADALHFMVELLIYSNIQPDDIVRYLESKYGLKGEDPIEIITEQYKKSHPSIGVNLLDKYKYQDEVDQIEDENLYQACKLYREDTYNDIRSLSWDITLRLNLARNCLKNKPWKRSQVMTDENNFQENLVMAFILLIKLFTYVGLNTQTIYHIYFKKNMVNKFRIKSNY